MTQHRFCHEIVVDRQKNEIRMDGVAFPYWTGPDPEIELMGPGMPAVLTIGVFADNLTYISDQGEPKVLAQASPRAESEWAKRRAKEIVLEGLADVVEWLGRAEARRQNHTGWDEGAFGGHEVPVAGVAEPVDYRDLQ
jgi:hypothetical protein